MNHFTPTEREALTHGWAAYELSKKTRDKTMRLTLQEHTQGCIRVIRDRLNQIREGKNV